MAGRRTNLALLLLLAGAFATGGLAYAIGTGWVRWAVIPHAVLGLAILVLAPWKSAIARRGLARPRPDNWASLAFAVLVSAALLFGIAHSTGALRSVNGYATLNLHVAFAILSVPFAIWHVVARRVAPRRTDLSRRNLLRAAGVLGWTGLGYGAVEAAGRLAGTAAGERRFTGSFEAGSFDPGRMPVTQWLDDAVPSIEGAGWRLTVRTEAGVRTLALGDLERGDRVRATVDCTGGWFAEQDWEGARLDRLLGDPGEARSVFVRSVTGYGRRFPVRDLSRLWLATRAGAEPLSAGHGYPARVVAPGRRGFWWVKWVTEIELSPRPWWLQSPFPLT
ncbi:MAG: molybdopterin-dependent oxidoreductase [Actinomycetota bacterium]